MSEPLAGRYQLLQKLGQGGMGEVWLARDLANGSECAVKLLLQGASPELAARLLAEFEALSAVRHPALVHVRELGFTPAGEPFLTMDFVPGIPAEGALKQGDWAALLRVAARVCAALEALHMAGVVHGDVKPQNILVTPPPTPDSPPEDVRLVDLGLAAMEGKERAGFAGTRGFAAPEVTRGERPTPASDLFGLGATLYALITAAATRPSASSKGPDSDGDAPSALPLEQAGASPALIELVLSLLAPLAKERPASATVVLETLARLHPAANEPLARRIEAEIFVGREREQARFGAALLASQRRGRVLLVEGDPGSGRTALLARLRTRAVSRGAWVAEARSPAQAGPAGAALVLLRKIAATAAVNPSDAALPSHARAALAGYAESLGADDRRELAEAGVSWLATLPAQPIVLLVDDFDGLDESSRAILKRMALHPQLPPVLWVWSAGRFEPEIRAFEEFGLAECITLEAFSANSLAALVHARLGSPAPSTLVRFLEGRIQGRPGLAVEWLRALTEAGALEMRAGGVHILPERFAEVFVADGFEDAQLARLAMAAPSARALVSAIAACHGAATLEVLAQLAPEHASDALDPLVREQILIRDGDTFSFRSRTLANRWFTSLPASEQQRWLQRRAQSTGLSLHERFELARRLADASVGLALANELWALAPAVELAQHAADLAESAGLAAEAIQWLDRAVEQLHPTTRFNEIRALLIRSAALAPADAERLYRLARAQMRLGHDLDCAALIQTALAGERSMGAQARLQLLMANLKWRAGEHVESERMVGAASVLAHQCGEDRALALAGESSGNAAARQGRYDEAAKQFRAALDAAARLHDRSLELTLLARLAEMEHHLGRTREALNVLGDGIARARAHGESRGLQSLLIARASVLGELADWRGAIADNEELARLDLEAGDLPTLSEDVLLVAMLEGLAGVGRGAVRRARSAWKLAVAHAPLFRGRAASTLGAALRNCGHLRAAKRWGMRAVVLTLHQSNVDARQWARFEYARTCLALGLVPEARLTLEGGLGETTGSNGNLLLTIQLGRVQIRCADDAAAATSLGHAEALLADRERPFVRAHLELLRTECATARGDHPRAMTHSKRMFQSFEELPSPADRAGAALDLALLSLERDCAAAYPLEEWLDLALPIFERLGDRTRRRLTFETLVRVLRQRHTRTTPSDDRGLLASVSHLLHSLSDLGELTRRAMDMVCERFGAERAVLVLADPVTDELTVIAEHGPLDEAAREHALGYSQHIVRHVTETGKSIVIRDATEDTRLSSPSIIDMRLRSVLGVPLFVGGRTIGVVYLDDSRRPDAFSHGDRGVLEEFAQLMAVAIEKSRGQQQIESANQRLVDENRSLLTQAARSGRETRLLGSHPSMLKLQSFVELAADQDVRVFLTGESGTGKEFVARELHRLSGRRTKPFITVNCGALSPMLLESELFGIGRGVATNVGARQGVFQLADGGTLLLDEIGEMPLEQQVKLLTVLQNKEVTPVGARRAIPVDVRVIAATNRDMGQMLRDGRFREDLFFRLNVLPIKVPPLRERKSDIPTLARFFAEELAKHMNRAVPKLSREFLAVLMQSDWPGNVRELQNYIARIIAMTPEGDLHADPPPRDMEEARDQLPLDHQRHLIDLVEELERRMIQKALDDAMGNQSVAARALGLTEQSLRYRLRKYGVNQPRRNQRTR